MSFKIYAGVTDISDYVVGASPLPYISRNSDFKPRYESFAFEVAATYTDLSITLAINDVIKVTDGSGNFLWSGDLDSLKYNYDSHVWEVQATTHLIKLKNTKFGYDQMHALFATGLSTQYWTDFAGWKGVSLLWALECAFSVNGLTLSEGTLFSTILFNKTAKTGWAGRQITYGALYFDEYQLYCLKLSTATDPAQSISEYVTRVIDPISAEIKTEIIYKGNHEPELSCLEFVEETLSAMRLTLKQTDVNDYELIPLTANYTVVDDDKYDYELFSIKPKSSDAGISSADTLIVGDVWTISASPRAKYYSMTETKLNELDLGGDDKINIMKNFIIYFADNSDYSVNHNESACVIELNGDFISGTGTSNAKLNIAATRYQVLAMTKTQENINSPSNITYATVVENFLDLENRTSNITQESYS